MASPTDAGTERLWSRDFTLATVTNALVMIIFYLLMTTMAVYAAQQFGVSATAAGLASSMFIIGAVGARVTAGPLVQATGPRRALLWSLVVFVAMSLAYLPAGNLALVLAVRFLHGLAFGIASTAATTLAQSVIPPVRRGEGTGYFTLGAPFAAGAGPVLALWLIDRWDYPALFLTCAAVSTVAWLVAVFIRPTAAPAGRRPGRLRWQEVVHPDVLPLATFMLLTGVASSSVLTYTHPHAESLGIADAAGTFFVVYSLTVLGTRLVAGRVQDRRGDNTVMYPAIALYAVGMVSLAQADSTLGMALAGGLVGAGFGTLMPTAQAAVVRIADGNRVGTAVATYYLFLDIGTGVGPIVLGLVIGAADHRVMYLVVAGLIVASAGYYHLVHGRRRPAPAR
ncbi:MFS transporter [Georgenia sp. 10Sc9-8]|uniref:MFS transporter n=1 Tax=Georgenia halotolerans TaxID=3028317 RepID=A0ABT5TX09_9MICO|nr:MFS transporter [Georgenia halotolerans]